MCPFHLLLSSSFFSFWVVASFCAVRAGIMCFLLLLLEWVAGLLFFFICISSLLSSSSAAFIHHLFDSTKLARFDKKTDNKPSNMALRLHSAVTLLMLLDSFANLFITVPRLIMVDQCISVPDTVGIWLMGVSNLLLMYIWWILPPPQQVAS